MRMAEAECDSLDAPLRPCTSPLRRSAAGSSGWRPSWGRPAGPFRLGLTHALAHREIAGVILELGRRFPLLRPTISNDTTPRLLSRLQLGELDVAVGVLPARAPLPDMSVRIAAATSSTAHP